MKSLGPLLSCLLVALATFLFLPASAEPAKKEPAKKTKILLIGKKPDHPFGTHMYMHTCKVLEKCLELTDGVDAVVSDGWPKDEAILKDVKTIVVYADPAAERLLIGPQAKQVDKMMNSGVGLVTIHWASSVYQKNLEKIGDKWKSYLGGTWVSNVGITIGESELTQVDPQHPVSTGWKNYKIRDEFYLNPTVGDKARPLLKVVAKDKETVVAWAFERERGGGRSYATTLGHFYDNFQREPFRQAIVNAILWTAHVKLPKNGAIVKMEEKDLKLPPKP